MDLAEHILLRLLEKGFARVEVTGLEEQHRQGKKTFLFTARADGKLLVGSVFNHDFEVVEVSLAVEYLRFLGSNVVYPQPWSVKDVHERFLQLQRKGAVQWSTTLSEEEAKAVLNDAISQAKSRSTQGGINTLKGINDQGVIDDSLLFYLSRDGRRQP